MPKAKPAKKYKGYLFKRGPVYWLQYSSRNADGKIVRLAESLQTTNKVEAEAKAVEITAPLLHTADVTKLEKVLRERVASTQEQVDRYEADQNRIPLVDAWERHPYGMATRGSARRELKPRVVTNNRQAWAAFTKWMVATRPSLKFLNEVTESDAMAYSDYCRTGAGLGARGHNKRVEVCRVVFNLAGIKPNPFATVRRWSETNEHRDALELPDIQKITTAAKGEFRLLVVIGIFTGLRLGDAVNLQWQDIRTGRIWKKTAKTGREVSLAVFPVLAAELDKLERPTDGKGFIMPELAALYDRDATAVSKKIKRLFEGCGIEVTEKLAGRTKAVSRRGFHSLRTTFVSLCARAGVPVGAIADWCGHSPEVNRIYQRWASKETDARILGALGQVAAMALSTSTSAPIEVEAVELQDVDTLRAELFKRLESADRETLEKILAML